MHPATTNDLILSPTPASGEAACNQADKGSARDEARGDCVTASPVMTPQQWEELSRFENEGGAAATLADTPAADSTANDLRPCDKKR